MVVGSLERREGPAPVVENTAASPEVAVYVALAPVAELSLQRLHASAPVVEYIAPAPAASWAHCTCSCSGCSTALCWRAARGPRRCDSVGRRVHRSCFRSVYVASTFGGIGRGVVPGLVMTRLGSGFHQFRTTRNDRQKRKPVWEGGEAHDPARQETRLSSASAVRPHRREMSSFLRNIRCSRPQHLQTMSGNHSPHLIGRSRLYNILDVVETLVVDGREDVKFGFTASPSWFKTSSSSFLLTYLWYTAATMFLVAAPAVLAWAKATRCQIDLKVNPTQSAPAPGCRAPASRGVQIKTKEFRSGA